MQYMRSAHVIFHADGLMQERRHSYANAQELRLSRTNPRVRMNKVHP